MKNAILKTKYVLLALVIAFTFSCSEDGAVGPQGTSGQNGADGTNGTDGTDGTDGQDGQDGNANVISSDWFTPSSYTLSTGFGGIKLLDHDQAAPKITQEIIDNGVVLVYGKLNGYTSSVWPTDQIALLPIILTYSTSPANIDTWLAILSEGNINIRFTNNNNTYSSLSTNHSFRYIVIPSSSSSSGRMSDNSLESIANNLAVAGVDINNFDEVLAYFGN